MKKLVIALAGFGLAATTVPVAAFAAQPAQSHQQPGWQSVSQRQAALSRRIDQGERNGALSRREAATLRQDLRNLVRLEQRYRASAPGLTRAERSDLDRRYTQLSNRIRTERRDNNNHVGGNNRPGTTHR